MDVLDVIDGEPEFYHDLIESRTKYVLVLDFERFCNDMFGSS